MKYEDEEEEEGEREGDRCKQTANLYRTVYLYTCTSIQLGERHLFCASGSENAYFDQKR